MLNLYGGQVIKTVIGAFRALRPAYGSTAESLCADAMREFGQYNPCEKDRSTGSSARVVTITSSFLKI